MLIFLDLFDYCIKELGKLLLMLRKYVLCYGQIDFWEKKLIKEFLPEKRNSPVNQAMKKYRIAITGTHEEYY